MASTETRPVYPLVNAPEPLSLPTPSLDPGVIDHIADEATAGYVAPARDALRVAHEGIAAVIAARRTVNENNAWSKERRLLKIAEFADKKQEAATKAIDSATKRLEQGVTALETSLNAPLTQDANAGSINGEIRTHMKGLSHEERSKLLDTADPTTLRAVLSGPGYLSGISEDERALRINAFHRSTQPEVARRADHMRKALTILETNGPLIFKQIEEAIDGKDAWHRVSKARAMVKRSEEALKVT